MSAALVLFSQPIQNLSARIFSNDKGVTIEAFLTEVKGEKINDVGVCP